MNERGPVVVLTGKNVGVAIILTVLLGPLGMLYSTILGAIIMLIVSFVLAFLTAGLSLLLTWPICILWAAMAAASHNKKLAAKLGRPAHVV